MVVKLNFSDGALKNILLLIVSAAMILTGLFAIPLPNDGVFEIIAMLCAKWISVGLGCLVGLAVCASLIISLIRNL